MGTNTYPQTWEDGSVRSTGNSFDWQDPNARAVKEAQERERAFWKANYAKRKERAIAAATRVNKSVDLGAHGGIANALKNKASSRVNG
jgi:hypothetical protein